ncbi:MAG: hypothetical protein H6Q70_1919 [Firmicutes bacterium]|nr:hypothetical protein [Bacillota bacterium]
MIKKFFLMKIIAALFLVVVWYAFAVMNFISSFPKINEGVSYDLEGELSGDFLSKGKLYIDKLNYHLNENVYMRYSFVELYGFLQRLMDKNEENNFEVVKDKEGWGHYEYFGKNNGGVDPRLAERVKNLADFAQSQTKIIAIIPPEKDIENYTTYAEGLPNGYYNEKADAYIRDLAEEKVPYLDLRADLKDSSIESSKIFFKTDHHWRIETAFWAYQDLALYLQKQYSFEVDPFYLEKNNWNFLTYKNAYLGSMGRKTGMYYSGADDITLIYPKFNTKYQMQMEYTKNMILQPEGRFEETLLSYVPFRNGLSPFNSYYDKYASYLSSDYRLAHIVNENNPNGPKVLFIKDSIARPVAAFLSTMCSEVWLIDPRYYKADIEDFVGQHQLDYIFVMFLPQNIALDFFPFGKEAEKK